VTEVLGQD